MTPPAQVSVNADQGVEQTSHVAEDVSSSEGASEMPRPGSGGARARAPAMFLVAEALTAHFTSSIKGGIRTSGAE